MPYKLNPLLQYDLQKESQIPAEQVGTGEVTTEQFNYLKNVTEDIQNQIDNNKLGSGVATEISGKKINVKYDPESHLAVDDKNRLKVTFGPYDDTTISNRIDEVNRQFVEYTKMKYLKQIPDLYAYEGTLGEIVQYIGNTNARYEHGYIYEWMGNAQTDTFLAGEPLYYRVCNGKNYYLTNRRGTTEIHEWDTEVTVDGTTYITTFGGSNNYDTEDDARNDIIGTYVPEKFRTGYHTVVEATTSQRQDGTYAIQTVTLDNGVVIAPGANHGGTASSPTIWVDEDGIEYYGVDSMSQGVISNEYWAGSTCLKPVLPLGTLFQPTQTMIPSETIVIKQGGWQRIDVQPNPDQTLYWNES